MQRLAYLDGWRGCAILSVLAAHFGNSDFINLGRFGVELFFVLSGRLMAEILFIHATPLASFFPRRFARVYPALIVFATLLLATAGWRANDPSLDDYLCAITFTANYAQIWIGPSSVLDHIWSLCIEEHMYLLLGLIAFIHRRRKLPLVPLLSALAAIGITIGLLQTLAGYGYYVVYWRTDVRGASLLLGAIAYLLMRAKTPPALAWPWTPVLLAVLGLCLNTNMVPDPIKYSLGTCCLATSLVLMARAPVYIRRFLESPMLLRIGIWSYSIYLWQQPFAKLAGTVPMRFVHLALALICALISFYCVEQPARRILNRRFAADRSPILS